jgi:hypothetical protein
MTHFARPALCIADTAFTQLRRRPQRRQIAPNITIRSTLMATTVMTLLALSSPLAHSQGGIGLPFSIGNDPTARASLSSQLSKGVMLA